MIVRSSIQALSSCHASLSLPVAVVKIRRIVVFIEARSSLEGAVRVCRLRAIWIILALRRLGRMICEWIEWSAVGVVCHGRPADRVHVS